MTLSPKLTGLVQGENSISSLDGFCGISGTAASRIDIYIGGEEISGWPAFGRFPAGLTEEISGWTWLILS
jgi:hypothetical protein